MEKNKRNKKLLLLIILAVISLVVLVSSFARYTSNLGTVPGTAKVATWNVTLDNATSSNVFKHDYTKNLLAMDGEDYIIAPGVSGAYEISITNDGDVDAAISSFDITAGADNVAVPMEFATSESGPWGTLETAKTALKNVAMQEGTMITHKGTEKSTLAVGTLYWRWPYEATGTQTNEKDTTLGTDSYNSLNGDTATRTTYALTISIEATQVAPTK